MSVNLQPAEEIRYNQGMAQPSYDELEPTIVATITEDGSDSHTAVHPGALLVAFEQYSERQVALPGIEPGARWQTIAVVTDDYDDVDEETALDAAIAYAAEELPWLRGQPILVDVPGDAQDIRDALETAAQDEANQSFAQGLSTTGDQLMLDLDEAGYDDQDSVVIAVCGDAVAVDGDLLASEHWVKVLGLEKTKHPQLWTESRRPGPPDQVQAPASWLLEDWLMDHGYESVERLGGRSPVGEEIEIEKKFLIERVAEQMKVPYGVVRRVADVYKGQHIYWQASDAETTVYAKPKKKPRKARKR